MTVYQGGVWYPDEKVGRALSLRSPLPDGEEDAEVIVDVVIPALNEEQSIPHVLRDLHQQTGVALRHIVVVDNGSRDRTAQVSGDLGAIVLHEPRRGYGQACLTGLAYLASLERAPEIVVFLDADYSDFPAEIERVVRPILVDEVDLVIGSRTIGQREQGALLPQALFGNALATRLLELMYGYRFTDLGPFRAIRWGALQRLGMCDTNYGWTVEMQIKAAMQGLSCVEVPVSYRERIGTSKVSGTVKGSVLAGYKILKTLFEYGLWSHDTGVTRR